MNELFTEKVPYKKGGLSWGGQFSS